MTSQNSLQDGTPITLEATPVPTNPPKFMAGQGLTIKQSAELIKILIANKFFTLPENKPLHSVMFLHIQADTNVGGFITAGYN